MNHGFMSLFQNRDCMTGMKEFPDKFFDLAIVDPPYRDEAENKPTITMRKQGMEQFGLKPTSDYFDELFRISKNQIIFGANNFELPPYKGFIVWRKTNVPEKFTMSMAEIAYLSEGLGTISKVFDYTAEGTPSNPRIHPTQKPVALYSWLLKKYAKENDLILDTHVGSGSSLIACLRLGYRYVGYEINPCYYAAACERIEAEKQQLTFL